MRRFVPAGIPGALPVAVALVMLTGSAIAFFSADGEGTASGRGVQTERADDLNRHRKRGGNGDAELEQRDRPRSRHRLLLRHS